jgi:hypothetical protein
VPTTEDQHAHCCLKQDEVTRHSLPGAAATRCPVVMIVDALLDRELGRQAQLERTARVRARGIFR